MLVSYLKQLIDHKTIVSEFRRDLFDKELNVKLWKANELAFYNSMIEEYGVMETTVNTTCSKLRNTEKELKRKFFKSDIEEQEEKRKKKEGKRTNNRRNRIKLKGFLTPLMCFLKKLLVLP